MPRTFNTKNTFPLFTVILSGLVSTHSIANAQQSLFDLSLEELLNVSVASSRSESVIDTPAIVSRYNREDLELMGVTNLREMFNFIPGVISQESLPGWSSVQIRGIDEAFNQKVLFLLDGIPYHQPSHSLIPMEGVPWESILHVEVIRGPGAIFHGTQASGGVFNVVTKQSLEGNTASLRVGEGQLIQGSTYINTALSDKSNISFAAEVRTDDGFEQNYVEKFPDVVVSDTVKRKLEKKSAMVRFNYNDVRVLFQTFESTTVGINDGYTNEVTLQPFVTDSKGYLIHAENTWQTDNSEIKVFADYNHYTFDLTLKNLFGAGVDAVAQKENDGDDDYRIRIGASFDYKYSDSVDIVSGIENETRSVGSYGLYPFSDQSSALLTLFDADKIDELSAYSQVSYTQQNWRVLIGARYTDNELNGAKVTPRLALVYKLDEHQSIKVLYSTGFNSPNPTQTRINLPGDVTGNTELNAEVVKATDIAYSYSKDNILLVANVYHLQAEDFIIRRFDEALNSVSFFNEGNYERRGAELDLQYTQQNSKFFANLAYQQQGNNYSLSDPDAFRIPKMTMSIGFTQKLGGIHNIGGNVSHIGERQNLDSYNLVNVNYTAKFKQYELFVTAKNLLDEKALNPNNTAQLSELVAPNEGMKLLAGVKVNF